ncbi:uncharacterized protein K452DRAFT_249873 [Aplosporella prunicola CBS 121167]|uniref:Glutathione hydrolase n=1 Tax=Aplosporella prunicola CBS 121167 TaxID=1176127 RepID=A0A6A6BEU3_9PEZI|nr:uncharacterized protein K452DRAFT_249873 [Aplosporella prunicola CBS 121167]KAF2142078.1 hypothetical protein K452DRAFT_249873 [Aplosporella prunicola CBS 121167]
MPSKSLARFGTGLFASFLLFQFVLAIPLASNSTDGKLGAVASENSICSKIGTDLLKRGGNAADAMVGTVFCVGTVAMYHSGIAGGGFLVVRSPNGTYEFINFRETAPAAAFEEMYRNNEDASIYGGLASGVPGELRGLEYLHRNYGSKNLSWKDVVLPSVALARNGFRVNEDLVKYMNSATAGESDFLVEDPTWAIDFAPHGRRVQLNETITRKRYADTLETIASDGADAFYTGPIAEATIQALQAANGTMTLEDLQNYTALTQEPLSINYRGFKLTTGRAPCSGGVALSALKIVEGYNDFGDSKNVNLTTHRLDEAIKFVYGERTQLGDSATDENMDQYQEEMLSDSFASSKRNNISDSHTHDASFYDPRGAEILDTPGTSHVVAADESGLAITLTTTVNLLFGSRLMVPETGVIMNNEMNDFSIPGSSDAFGFIPTPANYIKPGKRPLSSISPVLVEWPNGTFYIAVGSAGGSRIITATIQNLHYMLDLGLTAPQALAQPRLHDQLYPTYVSFEYAYNNETVHFMQSLGHNVTWAAPGQSTAQALRRLTNGTFEAASEPRQVNSGGYVV